MTIKIIQPRQRGRGSSFFYEGTIAKTENKTHEFALIAAGDIRLHNKDGRYIYNSNAGIEYILTDKEVADAEKNGWEWIYNNWFEVIFTKKGTDIADSIMGDVAYTYAEGIALLKFYAKTGVDNIY